MGIRSQQIAERVAQLPGLQTDWAATGYGPDVEAAIRKMFIDPAPHDGISPDARRLIPPAEERGIYLALHALEAQLAYLASGHIIH